MSGLGEVLPMLSGVQISSQLSIECMFTSSAAAAVLASFLQEIVVVNVRDRC